MRVVNARRNHYVALLSFVSQWRVRRPYLLTRATQNPPAIVLLVVG